MKLSSLWITVPGLFTLLATHALGAPAIRLGVSGLTHGHVDGFLYEVTHRADYELAGVAESSQEPINRYFAKYGIKRERLVPDVTSLVDKFRPDVIAAFGTTSDQLETVRAAIAKRIPVMLEKPLGGRLADAVEIERLSRESGVPIFVNYETTWYPNTSFLFSSKLKNQVGSLKKVVVRSGHRGPLEIGVPKEFFAWLSDPGKGGGALLDFGCYGVQILTQLFGDTRAVAVTAITQKLKNDVAYRQVEDEATIVVEYPGAQGIVHASWNWTWSRKDWEVYGDRASAMSRGRDQVAFVDTNAHSWIENAPAVSSADGDALSHLRALLGKGGSASPVTKDLGSAKLNLEVTRILDAARRSAQSGKRVSL